MGECALRDAVIYYYIRQTTITLCRNALVVDTTNEKRREEDDEAHGAVTMSQSITLCCKLSYASHVQEV